MSNRYVGAWLQDGAFNPLAAPPIANYFPYLYTWGNSNYGQLGLGNRTNYSSPMQVGSLTNWSTVAAGRYFTIAIKNDGTLWSWGYGSSGQLGFNAVYVSSPNQIGALTNWSTCSAGYTHGLAIKTDGTLWGWGYNTNGEVGVGNTNLYSSPIQIGTLTTWASCTAGYQSSFAVKKDGTLYAWGSGANGQLGLGNTTNYSSPKQVGVLTNWSKITNGGQYFTLAVKTDGTLWSWGNNTGGMLGLGNTASYSSPKQVGILTNWSNTFAGAGGLGGWSLAIKTDGTLWSWGSNGQGYLGLGNTAYYSSPKQIGALTSWLKITSGFYSVTAKAIKNDGTLWTWGYGYYGTSGLGNTTRYLSPKQIGTLTTWYTISSGVDHVVATLY